VPSESSNYKSSKRTGKISKGSPEMNNKGSNKKTIGEKNKVNDSNDSKQTGNGRGPVKSRCPLLLRLSGKLLCRPNFLPHHRPYLHNRLCTRQLHQQPGRRRCRSIRVKASLRFPLLKQCHRPQPCQALHSVLCNRMFRRWIPAPFLALRSLYWQNPLFYMHRHYLRLRRYLQLPSCQAKPSVLHAPFNPNKSLHR
jgi:hypothetical protein